MSLEVRAVTALLDVDLTVAPGETLAVAGPSGAGKTSLLRVVAGLARPETGRVACGDEVWFDAAAGVDLPPERRRCGYLFQQYALFPHLSVARNVAYGMATPDPRRAAALLEGLGVGHLAERRPPTLSGGEAQRVALARALARAPRALLLDEPLSALDARTRSRAARALGEVLRDGGVPALLVTHDFAEAALLADRIAVMDGGRIVQTGTATELAARPASGFVADFSGAVVLTGQAAPGDGGLTEVALDGGGRVVSPDARTGPVAVSVHPWEISLEPAGSAPSGSAQNRLEVEVRSVAEIGSRVRVGLAAPQPLVAEISPPAARELSPAEGRTMQAVWKATATRLTDR